MSDTVKGQSTVEQGTKFELEVAEILEAYGYKVQHNVVLKGHSGAPHQIDVVAEFAGPLHRDYMIVECKAYGHNVEKDVLMKQLVICRDIGFGGIMVFTTADFASGCYTTAKECSHVTLVNGDAVRTMSKSVTQGAASRPVYVKPFITESRAKKYAKSKAKKMSGSLFHKRPKVTVKSVTPVCYPYHTIKYHHEKTEKRGLFRKVEILRKIPHEASVDARLGVVVSAGKGVSYGLDFMKDLKPEDITLLRSANKKKMITKREINATGISKDTVAKCMPRLHGLGHVTRMSMQGEPVYKANRAVPAKITSVPQAYAKHMSYDAPGIIVGSLLPVGQAINSIGWLGGAVDGANTSYYPFFDIRYEDKKGTQYNEMLDAVTGKAVDKLRDTMSEWRPPVQESDEPRETSDDESEGEAGMPTPGVEPEPKAASESPAGTVPDEPAGPEEVLETGEDIPDAKNDIERVHDSVGQTAGSGQDAGSMAGVEDGAERLLQDTHDDEKTDDKPQESAESVDSPDDADKPTDTEPDEDERAWDESPEEYKKMISWDEGEDL